MAKRYQDNSAVCIAFNGTKLRSVRERREMSVRALADAIGAAPGDVEAWEKGTAPVGDYTLRMLHFALGCPVTALTDGAE